MALKETITIKVGATAVVSYAADSDFTTEAIEWSDFSGFAVSFWFPTLNGVSPKPRITIQVSQTNDTNSFITYVDVDNIAIPQLFEKSTVSPNYIRFVYDSTDVGAGSLITINFNKTIL